MYCQSRIVALAVACLASIPAAAQEPDQVESAKERAEQIMTDTRQTAESAERLTALADGLKSSVAGFKLA